MFLKARPALRILLPLWLVMLACAAPELPAVTSPAATRPALLSTPVPGATSTVQPFRGAAVAGAADHLSPADSFAPFGAAPAAAQETGLSRDDLNNLQKLESLALISAAQREALLTNGFVIEPRPFDSFAAAYAYGAEQKLPAFITADAILHTFRIVADVAWQRSEARYLASDLQALSETMVTASLAQWELAQDDQTAQAALRNTAFFAVAGALLNPGFVAPAPVAAVVAEELTLVQQGGRFISPLFEIEFDYGQFAPRDHYAQSESLGRYFRALAWLSRPLSLAYAPTARGANEPLLDARLSARQALLMTWALEQSDNLSRWERIFHPGLYFHGSNSAWSVPQVQAVSVVLYRSEPELSELEDDALLDDFLATMHTMPPLLPFEPHPETAFVLFAAPAQTGAALAAPDALIMRELVFNRVGAHSGSEPLPRTAVQTSIGPIRGLPRTLDVPAVLGSQLAQHQVQEEGDADFEGFALQFEQLQAHFAALEPRDWARSFDGAWLFTLQPLLSDVEEDGFLYAPAAAWQAHQLNTWHAAWTGLRHETTLGPRPVASLAISPDVAYGYLEPQPLLYGRLAALAAQILEGLDGRDLLDEESAGKLLQMQRLLEASYTIARKELAGERLTADEALLLSRFTARLAALATVEPAAGGAVPQTEAGLPRLVDVALEPTTGRLLQAATGEVWPVYVLVPREQGPELAMGAVIIGYELHGEQIAGGAWRQVETRPPPPEWLQPYVVSR